MSAPKLKPCPFCGGRAIGNDNAGSPYFYCESCDVAQSTFDSVTDAIAAWNTRTPTPAPNACAVKVKPLVWVEGDEAAEWESGPYDVWCEFGKFQVYFWSVVMGAPHKTEGLAKAAALAHHEARIMAAIETTPDPRDELIADAESRGMQRAADIAKLVAGGACDTPDEMRGAAMVECAIFAAIPKGGDA